MIAVDDRVTMMIVAVCCVGMNDLFGFTRLDVQIFADVIAVVRTVYIYRIP